MIYVDEKRCNNCGACLDVCPAGAIERVDQVVTIDEKLCTACEACLKVCTTGAILLVEPVTAQDIAERRPVTALREPAVTAIQSRPVPSWRDLALPALGTVLAWTGRTIVPKLVTLAQNLVESKSLAATSNPVRDIKRTATRRPVDRLAANPSALPVRRGRGRRRHNRRQRWKA